MIVCAKCGSPNRSSARFCAKCAAPLTTSSVSAEDEAWLADSLSKDLPAGTDSPRRDSDTSSPLATGSDLEEQRMSQPSPLLFAERYEVPPDATGGPLTVVDTQPWRRCWSCGSTASEPGERFCVDCGAELNRRAYRAVLTPADAPVGLALALTVEDPEVRKMLPEIHDQVVDGDRTLTILRESDHTPVTTPLHETAALAVGVALARLLERLHRLGLVLGAIDPDDLELLSGGSARLRDAPSLRRVTDDEAVAAFQEDVRALGALLERLTATPRTTQRLSEEDAAALEQESLAAVLRQVRTGAFSDAARLAETLEDLLAKRTKPVPLRQIVGAHTHTGIVREHNEDSLLTLQLTLVNNNQPQTWGVYIVADGMGGHAAGEVASGLAVRHSADLILSEYLARAIQPDVTFSEEDAVALVRRAVQRANETVIAAGRAQGNDMGTTISMALVVGDWAIIGNVGDSRTYLFRDGRLRRITKDHSLVQRLVDTGYITAEEVYTHPQRNAVLRSLGDRAELEVDVFTERLRPGDALLLCSDGQWEMTRDAEMERFLAREDHPQAICEALVAAANQAGGEDNIAVVLVRFEEG